MATKRSGAKDRTKPQDRPGPAQGQSQGGIGGSKAGAGMGVGRGDYTEPQPGETRGPETTVTVGEDTGQKTGHGTEPDR